MSSRHTRRKEAKRKSEAKLEALAQAELSRRTASIVRKNKAQPIQRNYYPPSSMGKLAETATRGNVARNVKQADYLPKGSVANGFNRG